MLSHDNTLKRCCTSFVSLADPSSFPSVSSRMRGPIPGFLCPQHVLRRGVPCGRPFPPTPSRNAISTLAPTIPRRAGSRTARHPLPCPRGCGDPSPKPIQYKLSQEPTFLPTPLISPTTTPRPSRYSRDGGNPSFFLAPPTPLPTIPCPRECGDPSLFPRPATNPRCLLLSFPHTLQMQPANTQNLLNP